MPPESVFLQRIRELEAEVAALKERLRAVDPLYGVSAEAFVAELIGGTLTAGLEDHDIISTNGKKFEVKFSRLGIPSKGSACRRWSWGHPLGEGGAKVFDHLILVGESDHRFSSYYKDRDSPYVLFDVPYRYVATVMRKEPLIQITTNPTSVRSPAGRLLFERFCITAEELKYKHKISAPYQEYKIV